MCRDRVRNGMTLTLVGEVRDSREQLVRSSWCGQQFVTRKVCEQEDEALERAKLRIDSLLKNKLGARSADFIEKYNMLYSKDKLAVPPNP